MEEQLRARLAELEQKRNRLLQIVQPQLGLLQNEIEFIEGLLGKEKNDE